MLLAAVLGLGGAPGGAQPVTPAPDSLFALPYLWQQDDGSSVRLDHWLGQRVLVTMDCSDTCSYTLFRLLQLVRSAQARGETVEVIVVGYNPKVDDARAWARFRRRRGLNDPHWHFLAGSEQATRALAVLLNQHYWFMEEHVQHEFGIALLDPAGRVDRTLGWENRDEDLMAARAAVTPQAVTPMIPAIPAIPAIPVIAAIPAIPVIAAIPAGAPAAAPEPLVPPVALASPAATAAAPVPVPERAPPLTGFVDDFGRTVETAAPVRPLRLIAFGYTSCPDVCPLTLLAIHNALEGLGTEAANLAAEFVTVDPQRDSVARLHAYVSAFDPRIRAFRGDAGQLAGFARALGVRYGRETLDPTATDYPMSHTSTLFLLRADGRIAARIDGSLEPQALAAEIVTAVRGARPAPRL